MWWLFSLLFCLALHLWNGEKSIPNDSIVSLTLSGLAFTSQGAGGLLLGSGKHLYYSLYCSHAMQQRKPWVYF